MANMARWCCCGPITPGVPCTDCDFSGTGIAPNSATVAGITGSAACTGLNTTAAFLSFTRVGFPAQYCVWQWRAIVGGTQVDVQLFYGSSGSNPGIGSSAPCRQTLNEGEWIIEVATNAAGQTFWLEKTTGFVCSADTKKISGAHAFAAAACDGTVCGGPPTVTVPA